jgi:hypothetical protein
VHAMISRGEASAARLRHGFVLLFAALALTIAACGGGDDEEAETEDTTSTTEDTDESTSTTEEEDDEETTSTTEDGSTTSATDSTTTTTAPPGPGGPAPTVGPSPTNGPQPTVGPQPTTTRRPTTTTRPPTTVAGLPDCYGYGVYHVIGATDQLCRWISGAGHDSEVHSDLVPKTGASCATLSAAGASTIHSYSGNPAGLAGAQSGQVCVGML